MTRGNRGRVGCCLGTKSPYSQDRSRFWESAAQCFGTRYYCLTAPPHAMLAIVVRTEAQTGFTTGLVLSYVRQRGFPRVTYPP